MTTKPANISERVALGEILAATIVKSVNGFTEVCQHRDKDPFSFPAAIFFASIALEIDSVKREFSPLESLEELSRWDSVARREIECFL